MVGRQTHTSVYFLMCIVCVLHKDFSTNLQLIQFPYFLF